MIAATTRSLLCSSLLLLPGCAGEMLQGSTGVRAQSVSNVADERKGESRRMVEEQLRARYC
ncbi:MAG: hypothetical protein H0T92_14015 [Pyrinomonadaceae bacterium]|nr:hypothetical protein [Pyrinomonadaceae bacterium]